MRDDDGPLAAPLQSFEACENPGLDERGAYRTFDKDQAIADGCRQLALYFEKRDTHGGDGEQAHDQHDREAENGERREQQAHDELDERQCHGDGLVRVSRFGEPETLRDVGRQGPWQCAQAPGDELAIGGGEERLGPPPLGDEPVLYLAVMLETDQRFYAIAV